MNVFEDLVIELKEANLLEDTVMDTAGRSADDRFSDVLSDSTIDESIQDAGAGETNTSDDDEPNGESQGSFGLSDVVPPVSKRIEPEAAESADLQLQGNDETVEIRTPKTEREFFRKRAVSEISSLQMVEAVLSVVERERMKIVPNAYDDLAAKKALHRFLQVADDLKTGDHKQAEIDLLRETEAWCSALASRDKDISVANVRRYCENCRPMLSSQAMLALARFYRNLPYSESVRGKFDFIITRLFSRPADDNKRVLLFTGDEMLGHVKKLYADWSSIPLYSADEDDSKISLTALSFQDLTREAENAPGFDDLIRGDFFGRLRLFKESIAELFYAPVVTAAAIECNVRIGNVYVDLIEREHHKSDPATIHERYSEIDDQTVSEAAGRTLELGEIVRERSSRLVSETEKVERPQVHNEAVTAKPVASAVETWTPAPSGDTFFQRVREQAFSVNKIFLTVAVLFVAVSIGLYVWANYFAEPKVANASVKTLSFQGTDLGEMVKTAKLSGETLYIVALPAFDSMNKESQTQMLEKFYYAGKDKGWANVNLMNSEGITVGYASATRIEMTGPQ